MPTNGERSATAALRTLLVSDLVGSTRLVEEQGDQGAAEIFRRHDSLARALLETHEGLEIDKTDGFLLLFKRPINAVSYALAYHRALAEISAEVGVELSARVGIHVGEVILRQNPAAEVARGAKPIEVEGIAKPMAARLMSLAMGRQTLLTASAFDMARRATVGAQTAGELEWKSHGEYRFKGVQDPVAVHEVGTAGFAPLAAPPESEKVKRATPVAAAPRGTAWQAARRRPLAAVLLAVALLAGAAFLGRLAWRNGSSTVAESITLRRSVAVLQPRNLSGADSAAWLSTAIAEMLNTELAAGDAVRTIGGRQISELPGGVREGLEDDPPKDLLERLGGLLGADAIVTGSYALVGSGEDPLLRLDLRLFDAATGEMLISEGATGSERQLFDLVTRAGSRFRQTLGAAELSPAEAVAVRAMLPTNTEAARLYSEGLARLRGLDAAGARSLLEGAMEIEPEHPLPHAALAAAWSEQGYEGKAAEAARRAAELSGDLPESERREIDARYYEVTRDWPRAIETFASLFESFPDDVDYGVRLAGAQIEGGDATAALATLDRLGKLPAPASDDPRIDLTAALAHHHLGDLAEVREAAGRAAGKGRALGLDLLVARARLREASALLDFGDATETLEALDEARRLFAAGNDRRGLAKSLELTAISTYRQGDLSGTDRLYQRSLEAYRELGDRSSEARVLQNLAPVRIDQGRLAEADELFDQSLAIFHDIGADLEASIALNNLGAKLQGSGDLTAARSRYQEAMEIFGRLDHQIGVANTLTNIAEVLFLGGDLEQARLLHEEALALNRELGDRFGIAYDTFRLGEVFSATGDLFVARQRYDEALELQERIEDNVGAAETRLGLANLALLEGDPARAETLASQAEQVLRTEGAIDLEVRAQSLLVRARVAQGKLDEAEKAAARAGSLAEDSDDRRARFESTFARAILGAARPESANLGTIAAELTTLEEEARRTGYVGYSFEAALMAAGIERAAGDTFTAQARLGKLATESEARGYGQIARLATAALGSE